MKRYSLKDLIITGIICSVIFSGIGTFAVTLTAEQVKYTPSNEKFNASNAKEAIDEIYKIAEYEIPTDTYFYASETSGENIVRYKKENGKYYLCDKNGKIVDENEQDISSLTLIEYKSATNETIKFGNAAFSSQELILGNAFETEISNITNSRNAGVAFAGVGGAGTLYTKAKLAVGNITINDSGYLQVKESGTYNYSWTGHNTNYNFNLYVNDSQYISNNQTPTASGTIELNAGDYIYSTVTHTESRKVYGLLYLYN